MKLIITTVLSILLFSSVISYSQSCPTSSQPNSTPLPAGVFFYDDFSDSSKWNQLGSATTGTIEVTNGVLKYNNFQGNESHRLVRKLPKTLDSNDSWRAEFEINIKSNVNSYNFISRPLTISQDCRSASTLNNNSLIFVAISDPVGSSSQASAYIRGKYLFSRQTPSSRINLARNTTYYFRVERVSKVHAVLSIFNKARRRHFDNIVGSPVCYNLNSNISNLKYLQFGGGVDGGSGRRGNASIDNYALYNNTINIIDLGRDTTLCQSDTFILNAYVPNAYYLWQDSSINATFVVNQSGTYSVKVEVNGCISTDTINVNFIPQPIVDLGNDTTLCQGETLLLDATIAGASYLWQDNSTNSKYSVSKPGIYSVRVKVGSCITTDSIAVNYKANPSVDLGNDTTLCQGETLLLDATTAGASYLWQDNSTNATFLVQQDGIYSVKVEIGGCISTDTINVNFIPQPVVDLGNDTTLCQGKTLLLDATTAGATYLWQDNSTSPTYLVSQQGIYSVQVNIGNCTTSDSIDVNFVQQPVVNLGNDTTLCEGETLKLDATTAGATYLWQDGSTQPIYIVSANGSYSVTVTSNSCSTTDEIDVDYLPYPVVELGKDKLLCEGERLVLRATQADATYEWQNGSTEAEYVVTKEGFYWVMVENQCGTDSSSVEITFEDCSCHIFFPNVFIPDNNGLNDEFHPKFDCKFKSYELIIFNRWGELVFKTTDPYGSWDGSYKGKNAQQGVYIYQLKYRPILGIQKYIYGSLTLMR